MRGVCERERCVCVRDIERDGVRVQTGHAHLIFMSSNLSCSPLLLLLLLMVVMSGVVHTDGGGTYPVQRVRGGGARVLIDRKSGRGLTLNGIGCFQLFYPPAQ